MSHAYRQADPVAAVLGHLPRSVRERRLIEVERMSQDVPLCPTSATDPSPILPQESGDGLTPAQRRAVAALISGQTFAMAARAANVDRRTLYRWRHEMAFQRVIDELSVESLEATATRIRNLMLRATRVLSEAMVGPDAFRSAMRVANSARLWTAINAGAAALKEREPLSEDEIEPASEAIALPVDEVAPASEEIERASDQRAPASNEAAEGEAPVAAADDLAPPASLTPVPSAASPATSSPSSSTPAPRRPPPSLPLPLRWR